MSPLTAAVDRRGASRILSGIRMALAIAALLVGWMGTAYAQGVYTVSHVKVDETAEDANKAKIKAIVNAQLAAFDILLRRITTPEGYQSLPRLDGAEVGRMMTSMSIEDERTGPQRYIATLTISFLPDQVRQLLTRYGVAFMDQQAAPVLILPVWLGANGPELWDSPNPWRAAWSALDLQHALTPVYVPIGDLTDVSAVSAEEALAGNAIKLESLALRYGTDHVLVAVAGPMDGGGVFARMSGMTPAGPISLDERFSGEGDNGAAAARKAAARFLEAMADNWKRSGAARRQDTVRVATQSLTAAVPFKSFVEWNNVKARVTGSAGVTGVEIDSLSAGGAIVEVTYQGSVEDLGAALRSNGLLLTQVGSTWVIQPD